MLPPSADSWYLSGTTASGKTALSLALARRLGAEIVSMDSMALYRGMDIGTAKPSLAERGEIPHHLIDVLQPHEEYSLATYVAEAQRVCAEIQQRGRQALFVGGTPLYLKALLRGIFTGPPADWELRRQLGEIATRDEGRELHARLAAVDAESAARLHPRDTRRIIRALEVYEKTGQPISRLQQQFDRARPAEQARVFVLHWPRAEQNLRIDHRVDAMFAGGFVDEVRALQRLEQPLSRTATQAVGYREVIEHLQGSRSLSETIDLVKLRTRQFAKRQMTWFRSLSECRMIEGHEAADRITLSRRLVETGSQ